MRWITVAITSGVLFFGVSIFAQTQPPVLSPDIVGPSTINSLFNAAAGIGFSATLILFFVWQAWKREGEATKSFNKREEALLARIQGLEDFGRGTLLSFAEKTAVALNSNTVAMQENTLQTKVNVEIIQKLEQVIKDKTI